MQVFQRRFIDVAQARASIGDILLANKKRAGQTPIDIQSFNYTGSLINVANSATPTTLTIKTQGDSDFLAIYLMGNVVNNGTQAAITNPYCRLQISDNSSQRTMFNTPISFGLIGGTAQSPYILQDPKLIPASTDIKLDFYNDMSVGPIAADMFFALCGFRVYY